MYNSKKEEEEFLEANLQIYPDLRKEELNIRWFTFLCHEGMTTQGDIDEHLSTAHGISINKLENEKKIIINKKGKLELADGKEIKNMSEDSLNKLMEAWYEAAVANNILDGDKGRNIDKINL